MPTNLRVTLHCHHIDLTVQNSKNYPQQSSISRAETSLSQRLLARNSRPSGRNRAVTISSASSRSSETSKSSRNWRDRRRNVMAMMIRAGRDNVRAMKSPVSTTLTSTKLRARHAQYLTSRRMGKSWPEMTLTLSRSFLRCTRKERLSWGTSTPLRSASILTTPKPDAFSWLARTAPRRTLASANVSQGLNTVLEKIDIISVYDLIN